MAEVHRTWTGRPRIAPPGKLGPSEIEPGRHVVDDWEHHLVERWADRKARLARERAERAHG